MTLGVYMFGVPYVMRVVILVRMYYICEQSLIELAQAGVKTVDVICPGFATDCLETLEEIQQSYAEAFIQAGGKQLRYIPALNASQEHITMLTQLVKPYL